MGLPGQVKRNLWLFRSAQLRPLELATILINKGIYFFSRIYYSLKGLVLYGDGEVFVNYNRHLVSSGKKKRALVAYLPEAFHKEYFLGNVKYHFSNNGTPLSVAQAFNHLGFTVDGIDYKYNDFITKREYDAFFFHAYDSYHTLGGKLPEKTPKILFETTAYWRPMVEKIRARLNYFKERHGIVLPEEQFNHFLWMEKIGEHIDKVTRSADGVIVIGDQMAKSFSDFSNSYYLKNAVYFDPKFKKDFSDTSLEQGRKNFLFFGGGTDVMRKGLDILLDSFIGSPYHLYISINIPEVFEKVYKLSEQPNIHTFGYLKLGSKKFYDLVKQCNFVIQPSAAEGVPGGVLDIMKYGLIPVVTAECNIPEVEQIGVLLADYKVETVKKEIALLSALNIKDLREKSLATIEVVKNAYSPQRFVTDLETAITKIMELKK